MDGPLAQRPHVVARTAPGSPRLPPGQFRTEQWPVVHVGSVPAVDLDAWDLQVFGEVEEPVRLSWSDFRTLPTREVSADLHCVIRWTRLDLRFRGAHWSDLARLARPTSAARFVVAHADGGYTANLLVEALAEPDTLLAYEADGKPLEPEHGWPMRLLVPSRYLWKSVKWLRALEVRADDEPGLWERYGYHNEADCWLEQRSAPGLPERLYGF
jgi:DMSO/TMAO reductase YedYZ molybdopterin-dependent catalytic subunit